MQKNRFCELTVISRFDLWRNCPSKSPFLPRFLIFRPWFLHQKCGANLKNGWLRMYKHSNWKYFPSDKEILKIRCDFMQNSCVKPKRLVNLHHVVPAFVLNAMGVWNSYQQMNIILEAEVAPRSTTSKALLAMQPRQFERLNIWRTNAANAASTLRHDDPRIRKDVSCSGRARVKK